MQKNLNETTEKSTLKPQGEAVFSLDIGTRTVVGIVGEQRGDKFQMFDYVVEPHTKRAMIDGQIEDIRQVAKIVAKVKDGLQAKTGIKLEKVSIAAAGRALKTKRVFEEYELDEANLITFDMIKSMEIETIQKAAEDLTNERGVVMPYYCVGHSIIGYTLDNYKMLNLEGHKGKKATVELIATFLPNIVVEGLYSVMDLCSLTVASLTLEPIAAMNAIIPQEIRLINIALVDIGAGTSDIAISKDGSIVAYAMATTAGDEITEEIIKTYFVDFDMAEAIKQKCCGGEEYTYKDIFGKERKITPEQFAEKIEPSVDVLAETICENIIEANGGEPAAVFLIGGGSLVKGLPEAVSSKLKIPLERVALGSHEQLKSIDTNGNVMGAEFVTPLGIAVTGVAHKGYDFSTITLNNKSIRVFDTNKVTVFELLTVAGYKSAEILGRSGRNLTYSLNGVRKTLRGGGFEPAQVLMEGKPVSLNAHVTGGDKLEFIPAICGENAKVLINEAIDLTKYNKGEAELFGSKFAFGAEVFVNGRLVAEDYSIQNLDEIELKGILTVADLLNREGATQAVLVNRESVPLNTPLKDGDIITENLQQQQSATEPTAGLLSQPEQPTADMLSKPELSPNPLIADEDAVGAIEITLNGEHLTLPANEDMLPHKFLELLNHSDLDFENPRGAYVMTINGEKANFNDIVNAGDATVLEWDE